MDGGTSAVRTFGGGPKCRVATAGGESGQTGSASRKACRIITMPRGDWQYSGGGSGALLADRERTRQRLPQN